MSNSLVTVPLVSKTFRLNAANLFLTYPQSQVSKEEALQRVLKEWEVQWAVSAEEKHADGHPHLHLAVGLTRKYNFKSADFADFVGSKHGDYRAMRSVAKVLAYVKKGGDFVVHGVVPTTLTPNKPLSNVVSLLSSGTAVRDIWKEEPVAFLLHRQKIMHLRADITRWDAESSLTSWVIPTPICDLPCLHEIVLWLAENIRVPRKFKQAHLWVSGKPGVGKSSFLAALMKSLRTFIPEQSNHYWDGYEDGSYDLVIFDEFKGGKTIRDLNAFLDGSTVRLTCRGVSVMKTDNLPTIFCSNYDIVTCFSKADWIQVEAFKLRVKEVKLGETFINLNYNPSPPTPIVSPEPIIQ